MQVRPPRRVPYVAGHLLITIGLVLVVLTVGWLALQGVRIYSRYQIITEQLALLENESSQPDLARTRERVQTILVELDHLSTEAEPFLPVATALNGLPRYGPDLATLPVLLPLLRDASRAGLVLDESLAPLFRPGAAQPLPAIVAELQLRRGELRHYRLRLQQHQTRLQQIEAPALSPRLSSTVAQLRQHLPTVIAGLQLAERLPFLLGAEAPQTYVVLTQNADEIRPSGGYINAAGHVVIDRGRIVEFVMQDSYKVDRPTPHHPYPPLPLYHYMAADYWLLRDAGWSSDFPTTAQTALSLYGMGQDIWADGVIAFDQHAFPYLLQGFDPLRVGQDRVTGETIIPLMRQHWEPAPDAGFDQAWWQQRKSFMIEVAEVLRHTIEQEFQAVDLPILVTSLRQALAEKHLQIYLNDPTAADLLAQAGVDGALRTNEGDFLMVVDANLGFNKASALVERDVAHDVRLALDGSADVDTRLTYTHTAPGQAQACSQTSRYDPVYEQNMVRCYWNYGQLLVPAGARLEQGPHHVVEGQYLLRAEPTTGQIDEVLQPGHKMSWGQLFLLRPAESVTLDYRYRLPPGTAQLNSDTWSYHLYLQKQPGSRTTNFEVTVLLPPGTQLQHSYPSPTTEQGGKLTFDFSLQTDKHLSVVYRPND